VRREGDEESLSEHDDAEAATEAAVERAGVDGATKVLVHDLYSRVHPVAALGSRRTGDSHSGR
jgi:hypothetical protein